MDNKRVKLDKVTEKWFRERGKYVETTLAQCGVCSLFYKPSLGHRCRKVDVVATKSVM